jgi:hypothetical protein
VAWLIGYSNLPHRRHRDPAEKLTPIYEATRNAPPLAVGMNEFKSESNFENAAKRLRLKAPLLAAGIFTAESVPSPRARHQCVTEIVNRRLPSEPERPAVLQPARAGCCDS